MSEVKKIIVFGATGQTGIAILRRAIDQKLEVTAYVRTPSRVPEELQKDVAIVQGDIFDKEKVENAIEGQHAVLSALGTGWNFGETTVMSQGCKNIVSGMKKHGVRKLVVVSVSFLLPGRSAMFLVRKVSEDHGRQLEFMKTESENIDWIALAAPRIHNNKTVNAEYMVAKDDTPGVKSVNTAELADFMVKVLVEEETFNEYKHTLTGISSGPKKKGWFS